MRTGGKEIRYACELVVPEPQKSSSAASAILRQPMAILCPLEPATVSVLK